MKFSILVAVALLSLPAAAGAHQFNVTTARILQGADRSVTVELGIKTADAERATGLTLADPSRLDGARDALGRYLDGHMAIANRQGQRCPLRTTAVAPDGDGLRVVGTWSCSTVAGDLLYRSSVLTDIDPAARQAVLLGEGDDAPQTLLDASHAEVPLGAPPPGLVNVMLSYLWAGIEHIATGYDHMAFLVAVVMWGRKLWPLVKVVTAFTVSHSVTLSLSALGIVVIPESITEPAIAATIIYVAVENFISRDIERRWRDTFMFGFIHGFGFASALREVGLPRHAIVPALAAFNIGVEIGQVTVIALALPVLIGLDRLIAARGRLVRDPRLVYAVSGTIAVLGTYWLLARTVLGDIA